VNGNASAILETGILPAIRGGRNQRCAEPPVVVPVGSPQVNFAGQHCQCTLAQDPLENVNQLTNTPVHPEFVNAPAYRYRDYIEHHRRILDRRANAFNVGSALSLQVTVANTGLRADGEYRDRAFTCVGPAASQLRRLPNTKLAAPGAGQSITATFCSKSPASCWSRICADGNHYIGSGSEQHGSENGELTLDVTDFTLTNTQPVSGDLNVKIGSVGLVNVSLTEPQGLTPVSIQTTAGLRSGVSYYASFRLCRESTNTVSIAASQSAPAGTSAFVSVTGTRFGVSHSATQSVRFFTASLENFSAGQPEAARPIRSSCRSMGPTPSR